MPRARNAGGARGAPPPGGDASGTTLAHTHMVFPLTLGGRGGAAGLLDSALSAASTESLAGAFLMTLANKLRGCTCDACTMLRDNVADTLHDRLSRAHTHSGNGTVSAPAPALTAGPTTHSTPDAGGAKAGASNGESAESSGGSTGSKTYSHDEFVLGEGPFNFNYHAGHAAGSGGSSSTSSSGSPPDPQTDLRAFCSDVLKKKFVARRPKHRVWDGSTFVRFDKNDVPLMAIMEMPPGAEGKFSSTEALPVYVKLPLPVPPADLPTSDGSEQGWDWLHIFVPVACCHHGYGTNLPRASLVLHTIDEEDYFEVVVVVKRDPTSKKLQLIYKPLSTRLIALKYPYDGWPSLYSDLIIAAQDSRSAGANAAAEDACFHQYLLYVHAGLGPMGQTRTRGTPSSQIPLYPVPFSSSSVPACMGHVLHIAEFCYPPLLEFYSASMDSTNSASRGAEPSVLAPMLAAFLHHCPSLRTHSNEIARIKITDFMGTGAVPTSFGEPGSAQHTCLVWLRKSVTAAMTALFSDTAPARADGTTPVASVPLRLFVMAVLLIGRSVLLDLPSRAEQSYDGVVWGDSVCEELFQSLVAVQGFGAATTETMRADAVADEANSALAAIKRATQAMETSLASSPSLCLVSAFQVVQTAVRMMLPAWPRVWRQYTTHHPQFPLLQYTDEMDQTPDEWERADFDPDVAASADLLPTSLHQVAVGNDRGGSMPALFYDGVNKVAYGSLGDVVGSDCNCAFCSEHHEPSRTHAHHHHAIKDEDANDLEDEEDASTGSAEDDADDEAEDDDADYDDDDDDDDDYDEDDSSLPSCGHPQCKVHGSSAAKRPRQVLPAVAKPTPASAKSAPQAKPGAKAGTSSGAATSRSAAPSTGAAPAAPAAGACTNSAAAACGARHTNAVETVGSLDPDAALMNMPHPVAVRYMKALQEAPQAFVAPYHAAVEAAATTLMSTPDLDAWLKVPKPNEQEGRSRTECLLSYTLDVLDASRRASLNLTEKAARLQGLQSRTETMRTKVQAYADVIGTHQQRVKELDTRFQALDPRIAELKERVAELDSAAQLLKGLQQMARDKRAKTSSLESDRSKLRSQLSTLRSSISSTLESGVGLEKQLQSLYSRIAKSQQDIADGNAAAEDAVRLRGEVQEMLRRQAEQEAACRAHEAAALEAQAAAEAILADISAAESSASAAEAQVVETRAAVQAADRAVADVRAERDALAGARREVEKRVVKLRGDLASHTAASAAAAAAPAVPEPPPLSPEDETAFCVWHERRVEALQKALARVTSERDDAAARLKRATSAPPAPTAAQAEVEAARSAYSRELAAVDGMLAQQEQTIAMSIIALSHARTMMPGVSAATATVTASVAPQMNGGISFGFSAAGLTPTLSQGVATTAGSAAARAVSAGIDHHDAEPASIDPAMRAHEMPPGLLPSLLLDA